MSWNPDALEQAVDAKMGVEPVVVDPAAVVQNPPVVVAVAAEPVVEPPVIQPGPVVPAVTQAAQVEAGAVEAGAVEVSAEETVDDSTYRTAIEGIGGLDELEVMRTVAAPLIAAELDAPGFYEALRENRGSAATDRLAYEFYDRHADAFVVEALTHPESIENPAVRARVEAFRQFEAGGGLAAPIAPAPSVRPAASTPSALPEFDPDDFELPAEARRFIDAAIARDARVTTIEARQAEIDRILEEDRTRKESERLAAIQREAGQQTYALASQIKSEVDRELAVVSFSLAVDPVQRQSENADTIADIAARFKDYTDTDPAFTTAYDRAAEKYIAGDRVGARQDVQALKTMARTFIKQRIAARGGSAKAAITAAGAPVNPNPRVVISGPGSGAAPVMPASPSPANGGGAWQNLDQQIDSKLAKLVPAAPVG